MPVHLLVKTKVNYKSFPYVLSQLCMNINIINFIINICQFGLYKLSNIEKGFILKITGKIDRTSSFSLILRSSPPEVFLG